MSVPGFGLLYLSYMNRVFDVTMQQIIIFIVGALVSTVIVASFFYGIWLMTMKYDD